MKEAIIRAGPKVEIVDSPVPKAEKGQVVIKVVYSGSNPKEWYVLDHLPKKSSSDTPAGSTLK